MGREEMKKTLIEKMESRGDIPKSWVAEVRSLVRRIEKVEGEKEEYGLIIEQLVIDLEELSSS